MAGRGIDPVGVDVVVGHAGEVVVRLVVITDVVQAEIEILPFALPTLRRTVGPGLAAARAFALRSGRGAPLLGHLHPRLDPDLVEEFGIPLHRLDYGGGIGERQAASANAQVRFGDRQ